MSGVPRRWELASQKEGVTHIRPNGLSFDSEVVGGRNSVALHFHDETNVGVYSPHLARSRHIRPGPKLPVGIGLEVRTGHQAGSPSSSLP